MTDTREKLTLTQSRALDTLREFIREHGYPPTTRELGDALGVRSTSTVANVLRLLTEKGYIHHTTGRARTLRLVDAPDTTHS